MPDDVTRSYEEPVRAETVPIPTKLPPGTRCGIHGTSTESGCCVDCDRQRAYDALLGLAADVVRADVIPDDEVRLHTLASLATIGVALGEVSRPCDGCDRLVDAEVYAAAGLTFAEDRNRWDDVVEVALCPLCTWEGHQQAAAVYERDGVPR